MPGPQSGPGLMFEESAEVCEDVRHCDSSDVFSLLEYQF